PCAQRGEVAASYADGGVMSPNADASDPSAPLRAGHLPALRAGRKGYPAVAPEALMMGSQKSVSWCRNFSASSGERSGQGMMPCSSNFLRISGRLVMRLNSPLSRVTSGCGSPAGAPKPSQVSTTKSLNPDSIMVGSSGNWSIRLALVTASALSLPERIRPTTVGVLNMPIWTSPLTTAWIPAGVARYGTWVIFTPDCISSSTPDM